MKRKKRYIQNRTRNYLIGLAVILVVSLFSGKLPSTVKDLLQTNGNSTSVNVKNGTGTANTSSINSSKAVNGIVDNGAPTFSKSDLADNANGWIKYGALDTLGRATQANALLVKALESRGSSADASIRPTGFVSGLSPYFHSRGHLIGRQLGGSGDKKENLATLYQNPVNTPYMTKYENAVRAAVDKGDHVRYQVTPIFSGKSLFPKAIQMQGKSTTSWGNIKFNVTILNKR
ncbi:DNA/RNA non-specific endonuclease [Dellaglioa sp. P0083]|uniref:DNA/RNA non-specific endonuclease n=1 Tax=Dellaglioa kimchii TaxID=3344667 RepID=UPI0038D4F2A2